jgi:RimJ/RimL family protein N-acetyltransferase
MVQSLDGKKAIMLVLFDGGRIAGTCEIRKGVLQNAASNAHFGLAIAKQYRGKGYGELLLRKGIEIAKRKFNPHRMWIEHVEGNAPAARLYKKLGFYEIARQNEYINHFGKWRDHVLMQYKGK